MIQNHVQHQGHLFSNVWIFDYVLQPAFEEKPAEDVKTAPQAGAAPVSWFGNGPTRAGSECEN